MKDIHELLGDIVEYQNKKAVVSDIDTENYVMTLLRVDELKNLMKYEVSYVIVNGEVVLEDNEEEIDL